MNGAKILTKDDCLRAIKNTNSNLQAARYVGVNKVTWRKYASLYYNDSGITLYQSHCNRYGLGVTDRKSKNVSEPTIFDVITGKRPASVFRPSDLKAMIIKEGLLQERCSCCGFSEERITDHKVPLMICFRNMNKKDWSLDNLELLCYNCYFLQVGDILTRQQIKAIQGAMIPKKEEVQDVLDLSNMDMRKLEQIWNNEYKDENLDGEDLISRK
jgi:hypothetical protein